MKRIYIGFISILVSNFLYASTLLVPSQFATIQSAINASVVGDTVIVDAGSTYIENINFMGKDIVVRTPNPATDKYTTFIDGNGVGSVALFISNETNAALLEGFTLKNGKGTLRSWWYYLGFDLQLQFESSNGALHGNTKYFDSCSGRKFISCQRCIFRYAQFYYMDSEHRCII
ncbi:MAG: hypothetical protein IPP29_12065 [Bacteroidetes bacterium]|nr:hypothetical protein [Bacteroidota bacterium]